MVFTQSGGRVPAQQTFVAPVVPGANGMYFSTLPGLSKVVQRLSNGHYR
jgi:hypothetical protein